MGFPEKSHKPYPALPLYEGLQPTVPYFTYGTVRYWVPRTRSEVPRTEVPRTRSEVRGTSVYDLGTSD